MPPKRRTAELNPSEEPVPKKAAGNLLGLTKYVQMSEPVLAPRGLPPRQTSRREIAKSMAKAQNHESNAPSSSSAADDSHDNYLYHVCVTLKNSNWSTIEEKSLYGVFGTRSEANEFAEQDAIFPEWGHGPKGCSRWETRYDRFGLIGIAARVGEEQHNVIIRVERHNLKNPPPECPGVDYSEAWAVMYEGELCGLHLYKAGAAKALLKKLKEMEKKDKKSKAQYLLGEDGLEGFRVSGTGKTRSTEVVLKAARADIKC